MKRFWKTDVIDKEPKYFYQAEINQIQVHFLCPSYITLEGWNTDRTKLYMMCLLSFSM